MRFLSTILLSLLTATAFAQQYTPKYEIIDNPNYPTTDLAVATFNVMDYGADNTGKTDCSRLFQDLMDKLAGVGTRSSMRGNYANITGGVLYIPEGTYLLESQLVVPVGVTIRGDWKKPEKGQPVSGTIIKARPKLGTGTTNLTKALFTMQPCTEVSNLTVWYPDQDINNVKLYPPTFLYGQSGFWGNEYCNVRHVTMLNSYIGIKFHDSNGGGCPNIFDVYGSPLSVGIDIDNIADVGRFDWISFAPDYWADSGLEGSPSKSQLASWLYNNATGIIMKRNDWSYTCNYEADFYNIGFHAMPGVDGGKPNGHNYAFRLNNCAAGILLDGSSYCGIMFTRINTRNCGYGVRVNGGCDGPAQFYECDLQGNTAPLGADVTAGATVMLQDCKLNGYTRIMSGQLIANANTFNGDVLIAPTARTIFTGNTVTGTFDNKSIYECKFSTAATEHKAMPEVKDEWMLPRVTKPAGTALYVVTDSEFGCNPIGILDPLASAPDCSQAIQNALDKAAAAGGGIVYLPPGHYRMNNRIVIPDGVELKGASDIASIPHGHGAILEVYADENADEAMPFITMGEGSGLRGITINYPNQTSPTAIKNYPYTIMGNKDVYVVNVGMRCAYNGVNLFTKKCDNHYVDYLSGHAFRNVIRIGGGSENGMVSNIQFNTIAYAAGYETKFGQWPNSVNSNPDNAAYKQNMRDLDFMKIEDSKGEILYNNFLYGCNKGMIFQKTVGTFGAAASDVHSIGNAVDGAVNTFVFNAVDSDLDLINSQIVALNSDNLSAYFITMGTGMSGRTVSFFSSDLWGGGNYLAKVQSGTLNLYNTRCEQSGAQSSFNVASGAKVNILNGIMNNVKRLANVSGTDEPRMAIESAVLDANGASTSKMQSWKNNLPTGWALGSTSSLFSRSGWKVSANNDTSGTGISRNAIDGRADTRWDTGASQQNGQWFCVDFGSEKTVNTLILDTMNSAGDGPAGYKVETQQNGATTWNEVATGSNGGAMLIITFDKVQARKIRITQTGSKGNYWSIHEINAGLLDINNLTDGIEEVNVGTPSVYDDNWYNLQGMRVNPQSGTILIRNGKKYIIK